MNTTIAILEVGNSHSVLRAVSLSTPSSLIISTSEADKLLGADVLIIPGVGTSKGHLDFLKSNSLTDAVINFGRSYKPIIGICSGFHILGRHSGEGNTKCLGLCNCNVTKLPTYSNGWYPTDFYPCEFVEFNQQYFFYNHGYAVLEAEGTCASYSRFSERITSIYQNHNIYGFQFHPEKSQDIGIKFLSHIFKKVLL